MKGPPNERDVEHYSVAKSLAGSRFTRSQFITRYLTLFPNRPTGSIIPSDYCVNHVNQRKRGRHRRRFLRKRKRVGLGTKENFVYEFVG